MMGFAIGAALMVIAALLLLLLPFRRRHPASADFSRQQLNTAIYRDQFAELERDRAEGALAQDDYDVARGELQRRLLEDSGSAADANVPAAASRTVPAALAIALPVGAVLLYLLLGNPAALTPPPPEQNFTADDIERMVSSLAAKLEKEPGNLQGWAMLARSYKAMGRIPEALRAFERAIKLVETSPDLLVDYADALASSPAGFSTKVITLIDQALQLDPANAQALWLRGTAAFEAGKFEAAAADWQRLLALLEPGSEDARIVVANIAEAQAKGGLPSTKPKTDVTGGNPRGTGSTAKGSAAAKAVVTGRVELAAGLTGKVPDGAVLMVVARPNDGSRMPVAVLRVPAAGMPLAFTLDDSLAMNPDRPLSQFPELQIEARISQSGQAMPQPGDLFGPAQTVKLGAAKVTLKIDQVRQ